MPLHRRDMLAGGLLTLLWTAGAPRCGAAAGVHGHGCCIEDHEADRLFGARAARPLSQGSGDPAFDRALAQTLSGMSSLFGVLPGFAYFNDGDQPEGNALANRHDFIGGRPDGTVMFGRRMLATMQQEHTEHPEVAVAGVCAHEFGHILQFKHGLDRQLLAGQRTVKRSELQADFLAGFFAGTRRRERPTFPAAVVALSLHNLGDYETADRSHHGTPRERAAAVVRGFETAYQDKRSIGEAIQISVNYVAAA